MSLFRASLKSPFFAGSMRRLYLTLNSLNIDIASGAVVCSVFAEKVLGVHADTLILNICLALSIWLVYTVDRLLDVNRMEDHQLSRRHLFHKKFRKPLWAASAIIFLLDAFLAVNYLPYRMLVFGMLMVSAVLAYMILLNMLKTGKTRWFQKEPLIALVYTMGVWGSKLYMSGGWSMQTIMLVVFPFFLIALMNLLIFSWFETESDQAASQRSLSVAWGPDIIGRSILLLFAVILTLNFALVQKEATGLHLMIAITRTVMAFVLFSLFYRSEFFFHNERYRLIGDAIFLIPLIPLLTYY
jgi:hypothetical protein